MKKKLLFLTITALLMALLCVSAWRHQTAQASGSAASRSQSANASNITGDGITGTVSYDAATNTLTLNGATLSGSHEEGPYNAFIYAENDLNIVLEGSNKVECEDETEYPRVIDVGGDLYISGSGSLACGDSENVAAFAGSGIYCSGDLNVANATLNFYVKNYGIRCWGDVELNNTEINIKSKSSNTNCISGNNITITGGNAALVCYGEEYYSSYGIYGDIVEICDAKVEIKAYYCGIYSSEALIVTGDETSLSVVPMTIASEDFLAVYAPYTSVNDAIYPGELKELVVENGVVTSLTALNAPNEVYVNGVNLLASEHENVTGVTYDNVTNTLTLNGAYLNEFYKFDRGSSTMTMTYGVVIYADGDLNIVLEGENTVTAIAGDDLELTCGVYTEGSLTLSGESLTVDSDCLALFVEGNASFAGCTVNANAAEHDNEYVIFVGGYMNIFDGTRIIASAEQGVGLYVFEGLIVYGGSIDATGDEYGVCIIYNLSIEGGSVSATAAADNGAALYFDGSSRKLTIGENGALTLNAATPVEVEEGKRPYTLNNNGKLTVYVDSVDEIKELLDVGGTLGFVLRQDIEGTVTIPAGADVTISGGDEYTLTGRINCTVAADDTKTTRLTLDGLTLDGGENTKVAVISQEQNKTAVSGLELTMTGCTVKNYTDKVAARGGASDAGASDIKGSAATVQKLTVSGCTFSATDSAADLNIGTDNKSYDGTVTGDIPANSTGSFAVSVTGNTTEVKINEAFKTYKNEDGNYIDTETGEALQNTVVEVGESAEKPADGTVVVTPDDPDQPDEPEEPDQPVIPDIPVITPPASDDEPDFVNPYTDVAEGAWYYDVVMQASEAGLMKGVTDTQFEPNGTLTRAMFWTILARASGVDTEGGENWYAKAQAWAMENGVSDGTDAMGALTREQLVTMLWRLNGEPVVDYLITAPDAAQISSWALEAMRWAASTGLIEGDETGALSPAADTTRAQAAAFMVRYLTVE